MIEIRLPVNLWTLEIVLTALGKEADQDADLMVKFENDHLIIFKESDEKTAHRGPGPHM